MEPSSTPALFGDPLLHDVVTVVPSCVHCRTVTWAGMPACGCAFGAEADTEQAVEHLTAAAGVPDRPDRTDRTAPTYDSTRGPV